MKYLQFVILCLALKIQVSGQTNIEFIVENLNGHKFEKVDAFDLSQTEFYNYDYKDTLLLKFKKNNIDCYNIRYFENGKMFRQQIWLDTGNIKVVGHFDSSKLIIDTVLNSTIYYKQKDFFAQYSKLYKSKDTTLLNNFLLETFKINIENPFSLLVGNLYVGINQNKIDNLLNLKTLTDKQGEKFKTFFFYENVNERLNKILTIKKIDFSKFRFVDLNKKIIKLNLKGANFYILDLWFLACPPCIKDHKIINSNLVKLKNKKVELVSISIDENQIEWKKYLKKNSYNWQNFVESVEHKFTNHLSIPSYPTYLIIDKDGNILKTFNSFADVLQNFGIKE